VCSAVVRDGTHEGEVTGSNHTAVYGVTLREKCRDLQLDKVDGWAWQWMGLKLDKKLKSC
jgi:hypothetical protein